ncbi:MAG: hypothetical protein B7Z26_01630 [Asticcacaulis sp. 32-58-5]|nr:MAG: hypothetical protein B7Z26_01630 [Asticcacaulis sp. 32-58-5]
MVGFVKAIIDCQTAPNLGSILTQSAPLFDVEFSLSIYNRTGKYFIGKDIIDACGDLLGEAHYGYYHSKSPPQRLFGKVLGRIQHLQVTGKALGGPFGLLPPHRPARPLLHMDPFSIPSTRLLPTDAVICHDVGPITHPELFDPNTRPIYDHIYKQIAAVGPHVIFVSQATQKAFADCYPGAKLASERVIYPAIRQDVSGGATEPVEGVKGPFLLTVGALGTRKNQIRSMKAFTQSDLAKRGVTYVLCGSKEPGFEVVQKAALETEGVVMLKYVSDAQLAWLYQNASGFVLPSLLEGFGMPVAEAIRYGLVPLVTKDSVLEEVAGEGALGVDAENEPDIAAAMIKLIDMPESERNDRRAQMTVAMSRFTPETIARQWRAALVDMSK